MSITPIYTAHATVTGGRVGSAKSSDGALDLTLTTPKELGGDGAEGTNPEQLFAAGYAACFLSALKMIARGQKVALSEDTTAEAAVNIGKDGEGFGLSVALTLSLPGVEAATADALIEAAHKVCPYSNATRGNIEVTLHRA